MILVAYKKSIQWRKKIHSKNVYSTLHILIWVTSFDSYLVFQVSNIKQRYVDLNTISQGLILERKNYIHGWFEKKMNPA